MNTIVKTGIVLGLCVVVWTYIVGFSGMYRNPSLAILFGLVATLIQIVVLVFGLRQTAAGRRYWKQVGAGTLISLVAVPIIIVSSLVFTTVAFPDYFDELQAMQAEMLAARNLPQEQIDRQLELMAKTQTPAFQAIVGGIATVVTGFVVSLVAAIWLREK